MATVYQGRRIAFAPPRPTPFIELGQTVRMALLFYLIAYRLLFPLLAELTSEGSKDLLAFRFMAELYFTLVLAYPFIFYRKEYGWLHPLVLPTVFQLGKSLAKNPFTLLFPLDAPLVNFNVETISPAQVLSLTNYDVAWVRLELSLVYCLAQTAYLALFLFSPSVQVPRINFYRPRNLTVAAMAFLGMLLVAAAAFVLSKGGISALIVGMRGGRRELFDGAGHLVFAATVSPMIAAVWFAYDKRPWYNPMLLAGVVISLLTALLVSGSRSGMIIPVLVIMLLWWKRRGKAMLVPTFGVAFAGLLVIGAFGAIRQDYGSTSIDLSVLDPTKVGSTVDLALEDIENRASKETDLAAMAGSQQKGFLWGRSYLNGATFWVPRAFWSSKPAGTDVYNMWINFVGNEIGSTPPTTGTWGIPVSGEMEAYWNFGVFGVIIVFGLMGMFHQLLARAAHVYNAVPFFWVFYINTILVLNGSVKTIIGIIMTGGVFVLFAFMAGIMRFTGAQHDLTPVGRRGGGAF